MQCGQELSVRASLTPSCRFLLQTVSEEQEHHLHTGPEGSHPEPRRAGGPHPGPTYGPERRQQGENRTQPNAPADLGSEAFVKGSTCLCVLQYPYETLFRSQHYALLDNGCREFLFLSDFFMVAGNSALDLFNSIMGKTLSMFLVRPGS